MISYLDTSLLVAACTNEIKTPVVQPWLTAQVTADLAISRWVVTEYASALSLELRTGQVTETERADALAGFAQPWTESLRVLPVTEARFSTAARFADRHELGLRAGTRSTSPFPPAMTAPSTPSIDVWPMPETHSAYQQRSSEPPQYTFGT